VKLPSFLSSIRAKLLLVSLVLLLIPLIGFRFVQEMDRYLREGQQQVLLSAARFLSATLSNRPDLIGDRTVAESNEELEQRRELSAFGNRDPELLRALGRAYQPSEAIERLLAVVAKDGSRIWVVDSRQVVRGLEGSLLEGATNTDAKSNNSVSSYRSAYRALVRPLVSRVAQHDTVTAEDAGEVKRSVLTQVDRALGGQPTVVTREAQRGLQRGEARVQSAAQPVWLGDDIVGAVVVEESDHSTRSIQASALEALLAMTMLVFAVGFVALMVFAWRLAFRVRRLQREADHAIDTQGRITGVISGADSGDEIGALAATLEAVLGRLKRYNSYLEQMAARLAHELRTPVAVVRSSLDNLQQANLHGDDRIYVERAEEGIKRMSALISRMSEASQLEQFLQGAERERFDLRDVIRGCVDGYRLAYPLSKFEFRSSGDSLMMFGVPDAIAQLLDKLIQNAVDFAAPDSAIVVGLIRAGKLARLTVENKGEPIPEPVLSQLFTSIITARENANPQDGHLGLGLHIVKLVAEFHGGSTSAKSIRDKGVVCFEVTLPLSL
jgi:two-component system, OmpR family, sensor histidine kinase ChvG